MGLVHSSDGINLGELTWELKFLAFNRKCIGLKLQVDFGLWVFWLPKHRTSQGIWSIRVDTLSILHCHVFFTGVSVAITLNTIWSCPKIPGLRRERILQKRRVEHFRMLRCSFIFSTNAPKAVFQPEIHLRITIAWMPLGWRCCYTRRPMHLATKRPSKCCFGNMVLLAKLIMAI